MRISFIQFIYCLCISKFLITVSSSRYTQTTYSLMPNALWSSQTYPTLFIPRNNPLLLPRRNNYTYKLDHQFLMVNLWRSITGDQLMSMFVHHWHVSPTYNRIHQCFTPSFATNLVRSVSHNRFMCTSPSSDLHSSNWSD